MIYYELTANMSSDPLPRQDAIAEPPIPWAAIAAFGLLLVVSFLPVWVRLVHDWATDEDMGHGFFVVPVAAYFAWRSRGEILAASYRPNPAWIVVILLGGAQLLVATIGADLFLARSAIIVCLIGILLTMGGWVLPRQLLFPVFLLCFMVPLPSVIYYQITFPLQLLASRVAEAVLSVLGVPVLRDGNILELPSQRLSVVEACSGIRSMLSLSFLSLVYGSLFDGKAWVKWVLLVSTVPIAIAVNALRVTLTGLVGEYDAKLAQGVFHSMEGWVIFLGAIALLAATHRLVNYTYGKLHRFRNGA